MQFWAGFWAVVLVGSLVLFATLAIRIGVSAFFDLRELLSKASERAGD